MVSMTDAVAQGKDITAAGIKTHYNELGEGPAVIMLHGGGPGASGWSNFRQNLPAFAANHRTILLDQTGFGQTDVPPDGLTMWDHLKGFCDELGLDKVSLVGNSMGGNTSLRFAFSYPERVDKLVLMGPGAQGPLFGSTAPSVGNNAIMDFYRSDNPTPEMLRRTFELIMYRPEQFLRDDLIQERFKHAMRPDALEWRRKLVRRMNTAEPPAWDLNSFQQCMNLRAPTLLVWGMEDRFNPIEAGVQLCKLIPGSRLHVFSDCGHWAQLEKAEEFNRLVLDFLDN